ncbi:MAG: HlyD family efflux transporter periplasmic adaptor subunit [Agitococcus sp.]|nr:HlyD family efflux transporter periplasmic adaptor subunit [Agitococcus sp.]MDO9178616.1 HlyD family efflux transporter periplasmic adaptor subunit [Agitococcus sp.]
MSSLFRQEAMQAEHTPLYANPLAVRTVTATRVMAVLLLMVAGLVAFAAFAQFNKKEHVAGFLTTELGDAAVVAPLTGTLTELFVAEDAIVKKGDPLFSVSTEVGAGKGETEVQLDNQLQRKKETLEAEIENLRTTGQVEKGQLQSRLALLDSTLLQGQADQTRLRAIGALSQKTLDKQQELVSRGYVSELSLIDKQRDKLEVEGRLAAVEQATMALQRERAQLVFDLTTTERRLAATIAPREREALSLAQSKTELLASRVRKVLAPRDGTVSGLTATSGAAVSAGEVLLRLTPEGAALVAKLRISPHARGMVNIGQPVLLQYASYPYRDYGQAQAILSKIAESPVDNPDQEKPSQGKAPVYSVTAVLASQTVISRKGEVFRLKPGMSFEADIVIERRSLLAWLFSPLFDARSGS